MAGLDETAFNALIGAFFTATDSDESWQIVLDGKVLRGTIPPGETQGTHLLAAYVPERGVVLMQVEVEGKANEKSTAPRLLKAIDLQGRVVTGDAMFIQRDLCEQIVQAIGGGTLRDMLLGRTPVFWVTDPAYILVAVAAGTATFLIVRVRKFPTRFLIVADAFGLAIFTIIGAQIGLENSQSPIIAIVMGVLTGTGGGIIRDLLAGRVPLVLRKEIYATASIVGAALYTLLLYTTFNAQLSTLIALFSIMLIRLMSVRYSQSLPLFIEKDD